MKKAIIISILLLSSEVIFGQTTLPEIKSLSVSAGKTGISLGTAIAVAASWSKHKSILWAILHGILSWLYVIYFAITRKD